MDFDCGMTEENNIYRSAKLMIAKHGDDAHDQSLKKGNEMLARHDRRAHLFWLRVIDAIYEMQNKTVRRLAAVEDH
jgi:hypothetical protein